MSVDILRAAIKENFPNIDTSIGTPTREILINIGAKIYDIIQERIDEFGLTQSLKLISENPENVKTDVLEALLSNWFATWQSGKKATGKLKLTYPDNIAYFIPANTVFTSLSGLNYINTDDILIDPDTNLYPDSSYYYTIIDVVAEKVGTEYELESGARLINENLGIINVSAWTRIGGAKDPEDVNACIARVKDSLSLRELTTSKAIKTVLSEEFSNITKIFVVGYGSREMQRDRANIFGIGTGGKIDVYIKTGDTEKTISKTVSDAGIIELTNETPIYRIKSLYKKNYPNLPLNPSLYKIQYTKQEAPLDIPLDNLARFSKYEKATITITDTSYFNVEVELIVNYPSYIRELQDYVLNNENRTLCADLLIKGFVPCYLDIILNIDFEYEGNKDNIKSDITSYVLSANEIKASKIVDIIYSYSNVITVHLPIKIYAALYSPNDIINIYSEDVLEIPTDYNNCISTNTVTYFLNSISFYNE